MNWNNIFFKNSNSPCNFTKANIINTSTSMDICAAAVLANMLCSVKQCVTWLAFRRINNVCKFRKASPVDCISEQLTINFSKSSHQKQQQNKQILECKNTMFAYTVKRICI